MLTVQFFENYNYKTAKNDDLQQYINLSKHHED